LILVVQTLQQADGALKKMQLLSSAAFSLGHSGNDSQKKVMVLSQPQLPFISMLIQALNGRLVRCCIAIRKWYI
jgi:hypothetical protein